MTGRKWFLATAAAAFLGWIGYLGYAVAVHRLNPPHIVSRSQLVEAEYLVVVEVTLDGDKPAPTVTVDRRLDGRGPESGPIVVKNLPEATTPANRPLPGPGKYLLPLVPEDRNTDPRTGPYKIAGWPRGLGESTTQPGYEFTDGDGQVRHVRPPLAYPWTEAVRKQVEGLGYK
jgi:hypothetical protein